MGFLLLFGSFYDPRSLRAILTKVPWHWAVSNPWSSLPVAALEHGASENANF